MYAKRRRCRTKGETTWLIMRVMNRKWAESLCTYTSRGGCARRFAETGYLITSRGSRAGYRRSKQYLTFLFSSFLSFKKPLFHEFLKFTSNYSENNWRCSTRHRVAWIKQSRLSDKSFAFDWKLNGLKDASVDALNIFNRSNIVGRMGYLLFTPISPAPVSPLNATNFE